MVPTYRLLGPSNVSGELSDDLLSRSRGAQLIGDRGLLASTRQADDNSYPINADDGNILLD